MYFCNDDSADSSPEGGVHCHSSNFLYKGIFCPFIQISVICCPEAILFWIILFIYANDNPQFSIISLSDWCKPFVSMFLKALLGCTVVYPSCS